jgi:glycosyltransferase involved in cell wall biosynthesis
MRPKILIVLEDTNRGGAETQALILAKGLIKRGYLIEILSFGYSGGSYWSEFESLGVKLHLTGFRSKLIIYPEKGVKAFLVKIKYVLKAIFQVKRIQPSIILPFTYPPNYIMGKLWKYMGVQKCYWNQRDGGIYFRNTTRERKIINKVTDIISNSKEGIDFLRNYTDRKIQLIHNGIILPDFKDKSINDQSIKVVMIANLHSVKDHITLLKAWKICIEKKSNIELYLLGKDADNKQVIDEFIHENNLQNSVKCMGVINNVSDFLKTCHIGVFSSVKEGLPNGILECMAATLPVVATKMQGAIEALGESYPFLSNPKDYNSMAQHLLYLMEDSNECLALGLRNRHRIEELFSADKMIDNYLSVFFN